MLIFPFPLYLLSGGLDVIGFALGLSCGTTAVCAHQIFVTKVDFFFCVPKQLLWIFRFFKIPDLLFNIYFKNWQKYTYRQDVLFLMCHFLSSGDGDVGREGAWGGSDMSPNCISCGKTIVLWRIGCFGCGFCANLNSRNGVIDNCLHSLKCCKSV